MTVGLYGLDLPVADAVRLDPAAPVSLDAGGVCWGGVRLERLDALLIHGFRYEDPVLPPADPVCDWSLWQAGTVIRQQTHSFLYSVWSHLDRPGGPRLYNPVSVELAAFDRFGLLDRLGRAGFAVPPLSLTNDDGVAEAFQRHHDGNVLWRPATGPAAWQLFRDKQRRALIGPERPPALLAAVVPGRLLRVYVLDGRAVLALAMGAPDRSDGGRERYETMAAATDLDPAWLDTAARAASCLGARRAMVLAVDGADGPVIYDVAPDPAFDDLPPVFAEHLKGCLAAALTGAAPPEPGFDGRAFERPALLLRRMLTIQFDMEATKYAG